MSVDDRYTVPALTRGLQLLTLFSRDERELSGAELARRLKAPRASVFRLLHTLEQTGFVERVGDAASYRLGVAVLRLGFEYLSSLELTEHGRPLLEALRDASGFSAHLVVRDGSEVVFIAKAPSASTLFHSIQVGARLPAHATVLGRVLLGDLDSAALQELLGAAPLTAYTPHTPTTIARLKAMIDDDRKQGYGISEGGYESGISTVAAPVRGEHERIVAAVSVTVPAQNIDPARAAELIGHVRTAANQLSERLRHLPRVAPLALKQKLAA
jgi:DNA-binding IclR family transcriptional regulator